MARALRERVDRFLLEEQYVFGITIPKLQETLYKYLGYHIDYFGLGYRSFEELVRCHDPVFFAMKNYHVKPPLECLVFPTSYINAITSFDNIFKSVWSSFQDCVRIQSRNGPISIQLVWNKFAALIGHKSFRPDHWGFKTIFDFIVYCSNVSPCHAMYVVCKKESQGRRNLEDNGIYLAYGEAWRLGEQFIEFYNQSDHDQDHDLDEFGARVPPRRFRDPEPEPEPLHQIGELKVWVSKYITPGTSFRCLHGLSLLPGMLGLVYEDQKSVYEEFRAKMNQFYCTLVPATRKSTPTYSKTGYLDSYYRPRGTYVLSSAAKKANIKLNLEDMKPEVLVAVHYRSNWRRGVIIQLLAQERLLVYLIDAACFISFHWKRLYRLVKDFLSFYVQGILGRLDLGDFGIEDPGVRQFRRLKCPTVKHGECGSMVVEFFSATPLIMGLEVWNIEIFEYRLMKLDGTTQQTLGMDFNRVLLNTSRRLPLPGTEFDPDKIVSHNCGLGPMHTKQFKTPTPNTTPKKENHSILKKAETKEKDKKK